MLFFTLLRPLNRSCRLSWLVLLGLLLASPAAFAQLSGAYTINNAQPTAGTNYASFGAAAAALTSSGVSGPVTITVSGGPYTEQVSITSITGASATNTVTINGGGRTLQYGAATAALPAVFLLNGAKYVTLNNLVVDATAGGTSTSSYGWGIQLVNNADNCTISNCTVTANTTSSSVGYAGIVSSASPTAAFTTGAAASQNLTITGNTVTGGYYGIAAVGNTLASPTPGLVVSNNTVRDFYFYGIYSIFMTEPRYAGNDLARPTRATVSGFYGIYLVSGVVGAVVDSNRLHNPFTGSPATTADAYVLYIASSGTAALPNVVSNNLVYGMDGNGSVYALYNGASNNVLYYYNTVYLNDQANSGAGTAYGFYQTTGTNVEFKNNILWVARAGAGANYAQYFSAATGQVVANYNDLVVGGITPVTGYYAGAAYPTLAAWRTANGGVYDQNSQQLNPQFAGPATANFQPTSPVLNGAATPVGRVATDITGVARSTTAPDIGAYEFAPAPLDAALQSIDSPVAPVLAGAHAVAATLRNNGTAALASVRLQYVLNGGAPVVQTFALSPSLASGDARQLTFTTLATLVAGTNTLAVASSLPNGSPDDFPANDAQAVSVTTALAGVYTINKSLPTGGANFASFAAAGQALTAGGVVAPVRFNVLNGPYTEQFAVGVIPGVSAADSVVVDGGASKQSLSYVGTATQPGTVVLNGARYVTIQNLTIDASATTYGVGVQLVGAATNNRVSSCLITAPSLTTSSTVNAGIAASGSLINTSSAGATSGLRIENNVISGGSYGIIITGASGTGILGGVRITGNEVRDFYNYGLNLGYTTGAQVINNNIHRPTRTPLGTFYGLNLVGNLGMAVERNRLHDTFTQNPTSTTSTYLIYCSSNDGLAGQENDFVNNVGYNLNGAGAEYFVYNVSSDYNRFYHNTFAADNQSNTSSALNYGFYQTSAAVGIDLQNNVFSLTRTGTGNRYALAFTTTTSTITSNYNDLYLTSNTTTGTNIFTGTYGSTNYTTLAFWRAANGNAYDQASTAASPLFAAGTQVPTAAQLNGTGQALARVPRDFNNVLRGTPPDMGAYEFSPSLEDVALTSINTPNISSGLGANPVAVTIQNTGGVALTSVTLSYTLNGGAATTQVFTLAPALALGASQPLTFATSVVLPAGYNILTVTASLPNGQPDVNPGNNSLTTSITLTAPPANDEPCGAIALTTSSLTGDNQGATTSARPGLVLPACSPATAPKDVWFTLTPSGSSTALTLLGGSAGLVRVFSSPSCSAGPFTQVFCASSGAINTAFTAPVTVTGLTAGTRYYVAVSGYGNNDITGSFTISASAVLATHPGAGAAGLQVYPNPSATGQLTLRLAVPAGASSAELLNALGQVVRQQSLTGTSGEQVFSTQGLAAGVYTLRVQAGGDILTRKVVLH